MSSGGAQLWRRVALLAAALGTTALWRFSGAPWVLWCSLGLLILAAALLAWRAHSRREILPLMLLATLVAPLIASDLLWPCGLACQGAAYYSSWAGVPVWALAAAAYGLCTLAAALALWRQSEGWWRVCGFVLMLCVGGSVWFLYLSLRLQLLCPHCLALHTLVLCAGICAWRLLPARASLASMLISALGLHALYHPHPVDEHAPASSSIISDPDERLQQQVRQLQAHLILGEDNAPWRADLVLDPLCPHCRSAWNEVAAQLGEAVGDGRLRLRIRLRHSQRVELSRYLAEMIVASAASDQLAGLLPQFIGYSQRDSINLLQRRWQQGGRVPQRRLEQLRQLLSEAIAGVLAADEQWLRHHQLLRESTPVLIFTHSSGERHQASGDLPLAEFQQLLSEDRE